VARVVGGRVDPSGNHGETGINQMIYAELASGFATMAVDCRRLALPYEARFVAGRVAAYLPSGRACGPAAPAFLYRSARC